MRLRLTGNVLIEWIGGCVFHCIVHWFIGILKWNKNVHHKKLYMSFVWKRFNSNDCYEQIDCKWLKIVKNHFNNASTHYARYLQCWCSMSIALAYECLTWIIRYYHSYVFYSINRNFWKSERLGNQHSNVLIKVLMFWCEITIFCCAGNSQLKRNGFGQSE